jgi:thiamine pyrophosphokinase
MKLLFIANGKVGKNVSKTFFKYYDKIICVDGGLNNLYFIDENIIPDYIMGDLDSAKKSLLEKFKDKSVIIKKDNQDETDLLFSINYFLKNFFNITEISIFCGVGNRLDHSLCNMLLLKKIPDKINSKIIGSHEEIFLLRDKLRIKDKKNKTISIIPLTNIKKINCCGLKWKLDNIDLNFGFINGISNIINENDIEITLVEGECLVLIYDEFGL